jgi:hypothetical protein
LWAEPHQRDADDLQDKRFLLTKGACVLSSDQPNWGSGADSYFSQRRCHAQVQNTEFSGALPPRKLGHSGSLRRAGPSIMDIGRQDNMPRQHYTTEQIIGKLREAEVLLSHPAENAGQVGRRSARSRAFWESPLARQRQSSGANLGPGRAQTTSLAAETRRLWANDDSCVRLHPPHPGLVRICDFVAEQVAMADPLRMLTIPAK